MRTIRVTRRQPHVGNQPPQTARESDLRIKDAVRALSSSERGRRVLGLFRTFAESKDVQGLDMSNQSALVTLVRELTFGGRRDFISELPKDAKTLQEFIGDDNLIPAGFTPVITFTKIVNAVKPLTPSIEG